MNKEQFKAYTKGSVSDPRTIARIMKAVYESDISDFFPRNMWADGNPFFEVYNEFMNRENYYSETSSERITYKKLVDDVKDCRGTFREIRQDIIHYLSYGSYMYSSPVYTRNNNRNK